MPDLDAESAQRFAVTDAGQHQNLRRLNGSGANDDFAPGMQPLCGCRRADTRSPVARPFSITTRVTSESVSTLRLPRERAGRR